VYFSIQLATAPAAPKETKPDEEFVKGESINIPVITDNGISGYFITKVSFMMNKEKAKDLAIPLPSLTTDELFTLLVGNKMVDMSNTKAFNLEAFRGDIKKDINERLGGEYVASVFVEQLDFLSKEQIRANDAAPVKKNLKMVSVAPGDKPPEEATKAAE
jgi:predicted DNA binding CopG/RHH family protein